MLLLSLSGHGHGKRWSLSQIAKELHIFLIDQHHTCVTTFTIQKTAASLFPEDKKLFWIPSWLERMEVYTSWQLSTQIFARQGSPLESFKIISPLHSIQMTLTILCPSKTMVSQRRQFLQLLQHCTTLQPSTGWTKQKCEEQCRWAAMEWPYPHSPLPVPLRVGKKRSWRWRSEIEPGIKPEGGGEGRGKFSKWDYMFKEDMSWPAFR